MNTSAVQAIHLLADITLALRAGLPGDVAFLTIADEAAKGQDNPFYSVCERLAQIVDHGVTPSEVAAALASILPELEESVPPCSESGFALKQVAEDLKRLQGRSPAFAAPAIFRPSPLEVVKRASDAVAHQVLNPLQIADLNLQRLEQKLSRDPEVAQQIREARVALFRASRFVRELSSLSAPLSAEPSQTTAELLARVDALFDWKPGEPSLDEGTGPGRGASSSDPYVRPILYVEDEHDLAEIMIEILGLRGFKNIRWMDNAQAALDVFDSGTEFSLAVSDYRLPGGMDGLEMARRIRRRQRTLPFIFVTGSLDEVQRQLSEEERGDFKIMSKPLEVDELADEMLRTIRRSVH